MTRDSHIIWSFAVYTVLWEAIIFGGGFWAITTLHLSLWWALLLLFISGAQITPTAWRKLAASGDTHPQGGDVKQAPFMGSAVPEGQTPEPGSRGPDNG